MSRIETAKTAIAGSAKRCQGRRARSSGLTLSTNLPAILLLLTGP